MQGVHGDGISKLQLFGQIQFFYSFFGGKSTSFYSFVSEIDVELQLQQNVMDTHTHGKTLL